MLIHLAAASDLVLHVCRCPTKRTLGVNSKICFSVLALIGILFNEMKLFVLGEMHNI